MTAWVAENRFQSVKRRHPPLPQRDSMQ